MSTLRIYTFLSLASTLTLNANPKFRPTQETVERIKDKINIVSDTIADLQNIQSRNFCEGIGDIPVAEIRVALEESKGSVIQALVILKTKMTEINKKLEVAVANNEARSTEITQDINTSAR